MAIRRFAHRCGTVIFLLFIVGCNSRSETQESNAPATAVDETSDRSAGVDAPSTETRPSLALSLVLELGNEERLELILIRPGTFQMGSPKNENDRDEDETLHDVTIDRPYYLSKFEITQGQWEAVLGDSPSYFTGDSRRPVESVTWERIQEFCRELSASSGRCVRLPTEAEWEYAARAGIMTAFSFGPKLTPEQANFDYSEGIADAGGSLEATSPVGSFPANAWGLHDMHGNVREWCHDWHGPYTSEPSTDPTGPNRGPHHVLRGGSWDDYSRRCRSAFRHGYRPGDREEANGFRVKIDVRRAADER